MKSISFIFLLFFVITYQSPPTFISLPQSPISKYDQSSLLFMLRCSSPLNIYLNNSLVSLSVVNIQSFGQWYSNNKPISIINGHLVSTPDLLSFTQFDLAFSISTPLDVQRFIVQVEDGYFFNSNGVSVPYSSPLIITRDDNNYYSQEINYNPLSIYRYTQKNIKSWEEKILDIDYKDSVIRYVDGLPLLDIHFVIPSSGSGKIKLQPKINSDGYEYQLDEFLVSISKKDQVFQIPLSFKDTISLFQEDTFKAKTTPSSRDEFFYDALQIKVRKYVCNEEPTLFLNLTYLDVLALEENNQYVSYQFRPIENLDVVALEYIWNQEVGWSVVQFLSQDKSSYGCKYLDKRNQFCPFCDRVAHKFLKTNISYYVFETNGKATLFDFGLDVSTSLGNSFYFKNSNDHYLGNSQSFLSFFDDSLFNLNSSYILVPSSNISDTLYYLWVSDITNGCNGVNITSSNFFYLGSCNLHQYSCSNIHYFRESQSKTAFINENYNYLYSNKRSGIRYIDNSLSIEVPQTQMGITLSLYVANLPFQQPYIRELLFNSKESTFAIYVYYSFLNYGNKEGEFSIQIDCTDGNSFQRSGTIKPNGTQDIEFSFQKSIIKTIKNYECSTKVNLNTQKLWSKVDKEIESSIKFTITPNEVTQQCNQDYSSLLKVSKQSFREQGGNITLLFTIQNQIDSIDMFRLNVSCSGNNAAQSKTIQIPTGSSANVPIQIQQSSNSQCKSTIESYQKDCKYNLYYNQWDYINNSNITKASCISLILILVLFLLQ